MKNLIVVFASILISSSVFGAQVTTSTSTFSGSTVYTGGTTGAQTFPTSPIDSAPTGQTAPSTGTSTTGISDATATTTWSSGQNTSINATWTSVNQIQMVPHNQVINTGTSSGSTSPLLSTVPQFNVMDVKINASGNCEVKKNGSVIHSGPVAGSPCQSIYGKGISASTPTTTTLPDAYLPMNMDVMYNEARTY
jgi:hypothetical protein